MWRLERISFELDNGTPVILPADLLAQCCFVLYPYVAGDFYWCVHEEAISSLRAGMPHPERLRLLRWKTAAAEIDIGAEVSERQRLEHEETKIWFSLHVQEVVRIEQHLDRLYRWHRGSSN